MILDVVPEEFRATAEEAAFSCPERRPQVSKAIDNHSAFGLPSYAAAIARPLLLTAP